MTAPRSIDRGRALQGGSGAAVLGVLLDGLPAGELVAEDRVEVEHGFGAEVMLLVAGDCGELLAERTAKLSMAGELIKRSINRFKDITET